MKSESEQIKDLKEEIEILKKQNEILGEACDIVSMSEGILGAIKDRDFNEAIKRVQFISMSALKAREEASKLLKPFFKE